MNEPDKTQTETIDSQPSAGELSGGLSDLDLARAESAEWRDKYVRQLAEFDNYRKRMRAELENVRDSVTEMVLLNLLNVYDDLNRTLEAPATDDAAFRRGVELVQQKFRSYLESRGVTKLECRGKEFNPDEHDAIMMQPRAGFPAHVVLEEVTPGYKLGERVIRHAQVIVSSEPEEDEGERQA